VADKGIKVQAFWALWDSWRLEVQRQGRETSRVCGSLWSPVLSVCSDAVLAVCFLLVSGSRGWTGWESCADMGRRLDTRPEPLLLWVLALALPLLLWLTQAGPWHCQPQCP
jgi:hypothetical protein